MSIDKYIASCRRGEHPTLDEAEPEGDGDFRAYIYAMSRKRLKRKCEKYAKRERKAIEYVATLKEES